MSMLIEMFIIFSLFFTVFAWRYHCFHLIFFYIFHYGITIISFICKDIFRIESIYKFASFFAISNGTRRNRHSDWHTMRIHGQMYF